MNIKGKCIIFGDANIDVGCGKALTNPLSKEYLNLFNGFGFLLCNHRFPTRITFNTATLIDHIFVCDIPENMFIGNFSHPISDHNL